MDRFVALPGYAGMVEEVYERSIGKLAYYV
jgi:hypothetical protein